MTDPWDDDRRRSVALEEGIRAEIAARGPMTFARFMGVALYHPTLGYYPAGDGRMTRTGDFLTAPETHPAFGALLARFVRAATGAMGGAGARIVEQGPGTGALARSLRAYWRAAYPDIPLHYTVVDPHGPADAPPGVVRVSSIEDAGPFEGIYLCNELPDAFPVHRLRRRGGALVEVYVGLEGGGLTEIEGPVSAPDVERELTVAGITLAEGAEIEVNPGLGPWISGVAGSLTRGYALVLDYGYEAAEAARTPRGTLLASYRHTVNEGFLARIGRQDLTAHVCWTALERHAGAAGFRVLSRVSQRVFLTRWGWKGYGRWLLARPGATHPELDAVDRLGRLNDGLGGLGALLLAKGFAEAPHPDRAGPPRWEAVPRSRPIPRAG